MLVCEAIACVLFCEIRPDPLDEEEEQPDTSTDRPVPAENDPCPERPDFLLVLLRALAAWGS